MELEEINNEIYKKIGINIVLFQKMEFLLKNLMIYSDLMVCMDDDGIKHNLEEKKDFFSKKTLGYVATKFTDNKLLKAGTVTKESSNKNKNFISISHAVECDENTYERWRNEYAEIIDERNYLVHQLALDWDAYSWESSQLVEQRLDKQHAKILPEIKSLQEIIDVREKIKRDVFVQLKLDIQLDDLRRSLHVAGLINFARKRARPDGWNVLSSAGNYIRREIPPVQLRDDLVLLCQIHSRTT